MRKSTISKSNMSLTKHFIKLNECNVIQRTFPRHISNEINAAMPKDKIYIGKGNGLKHWKLERLTILAIIGAIITAGNAYSIIPDTILAFMVPLHTFWGVNSILIDYVPTRMIKTALNSWKVISVIHVLGLLWLNFRDIGISKLILAFLYL